jgi:DNA-directed RNA polymerase specialized sigma24 family protein
MSPEQKKEMNRLKQNYPTMEQVYEAVYEYQKTHDLKARNVIFSYYYPLSLAKAWEFFLDDSENYDHDERARNAALDNIERWLDDVLKYDKDIAKLSPYFNVVTSRNFVDFLRGETIKEPDIYYGYEEEWTDDISGEDHPPTHRVSTTYNDSEDYPYNGIDEDDPETLAIKEEEREDLVHRVYQIRDKLTKGDQEIYDLLLREYNSDEIMEILGRSRSAVESSIKRIRQAIP